MPHYCQYLAVSRQAKIRYDNANNSNDGGETDKYYFLATKLWVKWVVPQPLPILQKVRTQGSHPDMITPH